VEEEGGEEEVREVGETLKEVVLNHNYPGKIHAHMDYFAQLPVTIA
jgi:hypothetical protein